MILPQLPHIVQEVLDIAETASAGASGFAVGGDFFSFTEIVFACDLEDLDISYTEAAADDPAFVFIFVFKRVGLAACKASIPITEQCIFASGRVPRTSTIS